MRKKTIGLRLVKMITRGLLALLPLCLVGAGQPAARMAAVDAAVWASTAAGETADFLVLLRSQAAAPPVGLSAAQRERARFEFVDDLASVAAAAQTGLVAQLDALGAKYRAYWVVNAVAVHGDRAVLAALAARPDVLRIESDQPFRVDLPQASAVETCSTSSLPWGVSAAHAPDLWAKGVTGQGTVFASADTGVDWQHPQLIGAYRGAQGDQVDHNYNWWDAIHVDIDGTANLACGLSSPEPCDDNRHGTHTTGIAVGKDVGVAPDAQWIACRNMDNGVGRPTTYIECLQFFIAPTDLNGHNPDPSRAPDVIDNSYGCPPEEGCATESLHLAVEAVRAAGIFMAVSAGNEGGKGCSSIVDPPATEAGVFTVGSLDSNGAIASSSSRGPVVEGGGSRVEPDLSAPGVAVCSSLPGGGVGTLSGTSMAAPHVAGGVLLLLSDEPALRGDIAVLEDLLRRTADPVAVLDPCAAPPIMQSPNNLYGSGRLNLSAAYHALPNHSINYLPLIGK